MVYNNVKGSDIIVQ